MSCRTQETAARAWIRFLQQVGTSILALRALALALELGKGTQGEHTTEEAEELFGRGSGRNSTCDSSHDEMPTVAGKSFFKRVESLGLARNSVLKATYKTVGPWVSKRFGGRRMLRGALSRRLPAREQNGFLPLRRGRLRRHLTKMRLPRQVRGQLLELLRRDRVPVLLQLPRAVIDPDVGRDVVVFHGGVVGRPADSAPCRRGSPGPSAKENL